MLALSIVAPNGTNIAAGRKTLEIRSWRPPRLPLRDLLLIENRNFLTGEDEADPDGIVVALVDVDEVHAWQPSELDAACAPEWQPGLWAWHVTHVRPVHGTFRLAARRKLYEVEVSEALRHGFRDNFQFFAPASGRSQQQRGRAATGAEEIKHGLSCQSTG